MPQLSGMRFYLKIFFFLFLSFPFLLVSSQNNTTTLKGKVIDENKKPVFGATVSVVELTTGIVTNDSGLFYFQLPRNKTFTIEISYLGYKKINFSVFTGSGKGVFVEKQLEISTEQIGPVFIESKYDRATTLERIEIIDFKNIPSTSGIEAMLPSKAGVIQKGEFSSQYSVRGGNFDENLVYINEIEIYRPLLVKAGQQEGLSILNPDLISDIQFSAGGFDAQYGDKMASVLDIKYKRPDSLGGSVSASLLGASSHLEMASKNRRFTAIAGIRYKSNKYLLNQLQTKGDYKPTFLDLQSFFTYDLSKKIEISFLSNISNNSYHIIPTEKTTEFGTLAVQPLKFTVFYDGQELDRFTTYLGALTFHFHPTEKLSLKLITSGFRTNEEITYDIQGQYWIDAVDASSTKDSSINIGVGTYLQHARNFLDARVYSAAFKGTYYSDKNDMRWGLQYQIEDIDDRIREWEMVDSAGYSTPYSDDEVRLNKTTRSVNHLISNRITGYYQNTYKFYGANFRYYLTAGMRAHYWSLNEKMLLSPRMMFSFVPIDSRIRYHAAFGFYYQPPFYKEMRDPDGKLHKDIKAQKSIHYVLGTKYDFTVWERPFIFSTEFYYKYFANIVPYKVEDVDIQYLPQYKARGYATGIEFKINGEFVENAESWATLSLMRTMEDIYRDYYLLDDKTVISPGYFRRPTDQFLNFALFFQDYFPTNPEYKVHFNLIYGTNLPYGLPNYNFPSENVTLRPYQRVDIGLSKSLKNFSAFRSFKDVWFNFEIFNLFGVENQASFQWVKSVMNSEGLPNNFAIPNYLTGRIFNIKFTAKF